MFIIFCGAKIECFVETTKHFAVFLAMQSANLFSICFRFATREKTGRADNVHGPKLFSDSMFNVPVLLHHLLTSVDDVETLLSLHHLLAVQVEDSTILIGGGHGVDAISGVV